MSKKPKSPVIGRIIIQTPEEQAAEAARLLKGHFARNGTRNKSLLKKRANDYYDPRVDASPTRPGADDALLIPSRYEDRLHYRDGRIVPFPSSTQKV